jgi:hypothetical protein
LLLPFLIVMAPSSPPDENAIMRNPPRLLI